MKIHKKRDLAFSILPYGAAGRNFLSLAAMAFFDLTAPEGLLTEQDMWKAVPEALGPGGILDPGMPKMRGEVLVAGAARAPRDSQTTGLRVRIRVGALDKSLAVFGERFWLPDGTISEPRPFAAMPLDYDRAFGGPEFPPNPTGKGIAPVALPDGRVAVPLPNIETPGRLVAGKDDRPEPAGLGPLDITWPQRARYNGTYDERWKAERWPGLPDDTDFLLFNRAPADQWYPDFLQGGEPYAIENMHPDLPRIAGVLPALRPRMFVTLLAGYKLFADPAGFKETFVEVPARLETVWLFPNILRGVVLYRGSIANADDEARDVARVYLEWERQGEPAASIEEYAERQRRAMDRTVPMNMAPFQAAGKKMAQAVKMVKNAPKTLARIKEAVAGRTPVMPMDPADAVAMARNMAGGNLATIDTLEAVAKDLHARFGHLAEIDLGRFDSLRQTVKDVLAKAEATAGRVGQAMDKAAAAKAAMIAKGNAFLEGAPKVSGLAGRGLDPDVFAKQGLNPDFRFADDEATGIPFHDAGFPFVVACRRALRSDPAARAALGRLGLPEAVVDRAWLGLNPEERRQDGQAWGRPKSPDGGPAEAVVLPAGLVFPRFDGATLNRLLIRPDAATGDWASPEGDVLVPGSDQTPLALPPGEPGGHWLRVADELQALFMEEEVGDACGVIALAAPGAKPDPNTATAMAAPQVLLAVILPAGTGLSDAAWTDWLAVHPNAVPVILPKGRTVFEARAAGIDIRALVMEALPPAFARQHGIEPALPEKGPPTASPYPPVRFPHLGIGQAAADAMAAAQQAAAPLRAEMGAMQQRFEAELATEAAKHGKSLGEIQAAAAAEATRSPAEHGAEAVAKLVEQKSRLGAMGNLTPETEATLNEAITRTQGIVDQGQARYQAGMARIASAESTFAAAREKLAARTIPGMTKEEMDAAGLDPDRLRPMTREEVVARHKEGLSFARRNLTGLDLSGLDLTGIDLAEAILQQTSFVGSRLDGASLRRAIAPKADFSKASLAGADLEMGLFMEAKLRKARLSGARLKQTVLRQADLEKADLSGARLHMAVVTDAKLRKAVLAQTEVRLSVIDRTDLTKADCRGAILHKTYIRELTLDRTDFSGATLHSVQLSGVTGRKAVFAGADMTKFRLGKQCRLAGTDFRGAVLKQASLRDSDLSGADFRGACLDGAQIELCNAQGAILSRISAKKCSILKTDLAGADLYGINLFMGSLRKSRLTGANLGRSNLYAVDFFKCVVGETNFEGANLKRTLLASKTDLLR
jgi:uncharacterized protein YjbI with pentapeptide repeats